MLWLENKHSGKGENYYGTLEDALAYCQYLCGDDPHAVWAVWLCPPVKDNVKIAEVTMSGVRWLKKGR
ncbi:MAG TPA: hypothetical protein VH643_05570 [Gemmataceae bacterium]|jgi:hypothetical protein